MFKRILVAVDGSDTAEQALQKSITLAKELGAKLRLVYVIDVTNINLGSDFLYPTEISDAQNKAGQNILDKASAKAGAVGVSVETGLLVIDTLGQRVPDLIVSDATDWSADLIVIGTHGRRGLNRLFLGSVAEGVVRVATKPVLLIRGT